MTNIEEGPNMTRAFKPMTAIWIMVMMAVVAGCGKVGDAPRAEVGDSVAVAEPADGAVFAIDTARSKVSWVGAKVTGSHEGGFRKFDGTITVADGAVTGVMVTVDATSIYTDDDKLAGHLKSEDFFAVEKFPTAAFESTKLVKTDSAAGATHMVTGNLTMHGVTHGVTFPATITVGTEVAAKADFKINRKDWGIIYPGQPDDLISDDVRIIFDIVAKPRATAGL
jgi:polyisoprenoid-binding protein YceI